MLHGSARSPLELWEKSESIAYRQALIAADSTLKFHTSTDFFRVAIEAGVELAPEPSDLNSASCQVAAALARCDAAMWPITDKEWKGLQTAVGKSYEACKKLSPDKILPLNSFGILPLFSTAYVAQYLFQIYDYDRRAENISDQRADNLAYAIAIRRLLVTTVNAKISRAPSDLIGLNLHPFVSFHIFVALRNFTTLQIDMKRGVMNLLKLSGKELWNLFTKAAGKIPTSKKNDFQKALDGTGWLQENFKDEKSINAFLESTLHSLEEAALKDVALEIAKSSRNDRNLVDPSALSFALLTLAERDAKKHASQLRQGLIVLLETATRGRFPFGRPFLSDSKGRSLMVASVEVANSTLALALRIAKEGLLSAEEVSLVLDGTSSHQEVLIDEENTISLPPQNGEQIGSPMKGWCSDRSASDTRIESWTTAHVMEFFVNRVNLLRWAKREHVFAQYSWTAHERCNEPSWSDLQDPNQGTKIKSVKEVIDQIVEKKESSLAATFLLYGPPGTSKTTFAQAVADHKKWDLISLSPSDFVSDSLDRIEFRSRAIFNDLMNVDRAVILFDEIDSLLRDRAAFKNTPGTIIEFVVPALLPKLQDFRKYVKSKNIAVFFLTNYYESLDLAIRRSGRIDSHLAIFPYSKEARLAVAKAQLPSVITQEDERWKIVTRALDAAPCNLVFQDIKTIVETAIDGEITSSPSRIDRILTTAGVRPQAYSYRNRVGCGREFCSFVARLFESDLSNYQSPNTILEASAFLKDSASKVEKLTEGKKKDLYSVWLPTIQTWSEQLKDPQNSSLWES